MPTVHARLPTLLMAAFSIVGPLMASASAQSDDRPLQAGERSAVVESLAEQLIRNYVFPDMAEEMAKVIRENQAQMQYDEIVGGREFAETLTRDLREVCPDKHLEVQFFPQGIPYDSQTEPDPQAVEDFRQAGKRRNYEFRKVERLDGGVGLLQVDGFYPAEWIAETAAGAMTFLANSEAVILDFRENHGGQSGATLLASYFFKEQTHLSDAYNRPENSTREIWSFPVAGAERFADKDLYILTSKDTFSAPEAFAYDLQALKRATIVGETTGGGAHPVTLYRVTDHFSAGIPFARGINPVTKTDYEGVGVKPDVAVPAEQALLTAHVLALRKLVERYKDDSSRTAELSLVLTAKEAELAALRREQE
jgi:retinol-binding protein 3